MKAIKFLDCTMLLSMPYPKLWNRQRKLGIEEPCRYLWYYHGTKIFGRCKQKKYLAWMREVLHHNFFPTPIRGDEEVCSCQTVYGKASCNKSNDYRWNILSIACSLVLLCNCYESMHFDFVDCCSRILGWIEGL